MKKLIFDHFIDARNNCKQVATTRLNGSGTIETFNGIPYDYGPCNGSNSPEDIRYRFLKPENVCEIVVIKPSDVLCMNKLKISFDSSALKCVGPEPFLDWT